MITTEIYLGPHQQEQEDSSLSEEQRQLLQKIRTAVLNHDGVDRLYQPATSAGQLLRTASSRAARLRASGFQLHERSRQQATASQADEVDLLLCLRLGTAAKAPVPHTVRSLAQLIRGILAQEEASAGAKQTGWGQVAISIEVVNMETQASSLGAEQ